MNEDKNKDEDVIEHKNDAGFFTAAALVGGIQLVHGLSKDANFLSWFRSEKKLFIQLLDSWGVTEPNEDPGRYHVITARFANIHIHSIHIESVYVDDNENGRTEVQIFRIVDSRKFGFSREEFDSEGNALKFPRLLQPGASVDVNIKIPELNGARIKSDSGANLVCIFSLLDTLGRPETISAPIRLRWDGFNEC